MTVGVFLKRRTLYKLQDRVDLDLSQQEFMYNWNAYLNRDPIYSDIVTARVCKRFTKRHAGVQSPVLSTCAVSEIIIYELLHLSYFCLLH